MLYFARNFSLKQVTHNFNYLLLPVIALFIFGAILSGCDLTDSGDSAPDEIYEYDFTESEASWEPFFTDYHVGWGEKMNLTADYRPLPVPLDTTKNAHFISAVNHSDNVKMLFRKRVEDLDPGTTYSVEFKLHFATAVPSGCFGIGGPPGEAVKVVVDASEIQPEPIVEDEYYLLNIQHLNDSQDWYQNSIIGDIANSRECEDDYEYEIKVVGSGPDQATVTADENGRAWLMFGTRSGFEGQTDLFYTFFRAEFIAE